MVALRAGFTPGASPDSTRVAVTAAVADAFKNAPCVGLEYAGEQARLVYSGRQPDVDADAGRAVAKGTPGSSG